MKAVSQELDLAVIEAEGINLPPVRLKEVVRLGDDVWVAALPVGPAAHGGERRGESAEEPRRGSSSIEGTIRMVDASVSYGSSGGGVFDAETGALIGIVEGYRTAQMALPDRPERTLQLPVAGETLVIPARSILEFLAASGLGELVHDSGERAARGPPARRVCREWRAG